MTLSTRIAAHLPFLRRYARAITGTQASGDAYVAATLEALIADVDAFPKASNDRVALFRMFSAIFGSADVRIKPAESPFAWEKRATGHLSAIPVRERQAFVLAAVEGFTPGQIGEILDVPSADVPALLADAADIVSRQVATDIMIIEDEPLIAMDIESMVEELGHRVTGIARTRSEAIELFARKQPGMVLADIQLADGSSGIDAVNDILRTANIPVIFITAFPERLLTGERPEPAFLVTKPFNPQMVKALISQALFFNEAMSEAA
jgi:CheY-like chemotaxis protein